MKYLDNEFKVIRYLAKLKRTGRVMTAHLDCLIPEGNDYTELQSIEAQGGAAAGIPESIPLTDAEFDIDLVKAKFMNKGVGDGEFDTIVAQNKAIAQLTQLTNPKALEATQKAIDVLQALEDVAYANDPDNL